MKRIRMCCWVALCCGAMAVLAQDEAVKAQKMSGGVKQLQQLRESVDAGDSYLTPGGPRKLLRLPGRFVVRDQGAKKADGAVQALTGKGGAFDGYGQTAVRENAVMLTAPATEAATAAKAAAPKDAKPDADAVKATLKALRQAAEVRVDPVFVDPDSGLLKIIGNDIILCLKEGVDAQAYFGDAWERVRPMPGTTDQFVLTLEAASAEAVLEECARRASDGQAVWAEPDFEGEVVRHYTPNDTYFSQQWYLKGTGTGSVQAEAAWDTAKGDNIVIAVFDDGVQINHPDLAANIFSTAGHSTGYSGDVNGWNFASGSSNVNPSHADDKHGTCVAGVAAAVGNNGAGIAGMAFRSKILPVKVFTGSYFCSDSERTSALRYAAGLTGGGWRGADVINISLCFSSSSAFDSALNAAATSGRSGKGCLIFTSVGNEAVDWYDYDFTLSAGTHTVRIEYAKNGNPAKGQDCVWLDDVVMPGNSAEGFEGGTFPPSGWTTGGDAPWVQETNVAYAYPDTNHGVKSARSGAIGTSKASWIQTTRSFSSGTLWVSLLTSSSYSNGMVNIYIDGALKYTDPGGVYVDTTISYPASHAATFAIGASTDKDVKSSYSQFGTGLDFVAPSSGGSKGVYTTDRTGSAGYVSGDYESAFGGTSSASPLVAGIGALILSKNATLTVSEVRALMRKSCDKIGGVSYTGGDSGAGGWNTYYGYGRLNAKTAIANTTSTISSPDFIVESINLSTLSPAPGAAMTATITVRNRGTASGDGGWLDLWADRAAVAPTGSEGDDYFTVGTLAAGAGKSFTHSFTASSELGVKTYRAFVDSANKTQESDETNNQAVQSYTVAYPVYTITTASAPAAGGTTSGGGVKTIGTSCTVTAAANTDYAFFAWQENGETVSSSPSYTFTVTGSRALTAAFRAIGADAPYIVPYDLDDALTTTGAYTGYIFDGDFDLPYYPEDLYGTLTLNVSKLTGKLSAKAALQTGSVSFSAKGWDAVYTDGTVGVTMSARTGETLILEIRQNRFIGIISGGKAGSGWLCIDGARDRFANKKDGAAQLMLNTAKGYYTTIIGQPKVAYGYVGSFGNANYGCGYLAITIGTGGSVKFAGKLADGASVSASTKLIWYDIDGKLCAPLFIPINSKRGVLGGLVWLDPVTRQMDTFATWYNYGTDWSSDGLWAPVEIFGGWYEKKMWWYYSDYWMDFYLHPMADYYYANNTWAGLMCGDWLETLVVSTTPAGKMTLPKGKAPARYGTGKPHDPYGYNYDGQSPMTTISFAPATGIFKGTSKAYYDYHYPDGNILHKAVSIPFSGVMIQEDDVITYGYGANQFKETDPALKAFKLKWSGLVIIQ